MDTYLRSVSVSGASVEDVVEPCFKVLQWLGVNRQAELAYKDVEAIMKGAVFVQECFLAFGAQLEAALVARYGFYRGLFRTVWADLPDVDFTALALEDIWRTRHAYKHVLNLESLFAYLNRNNLGYGMTTTAPTHHADDTADDNAARFAYVLQRTFQLAPAQIDDAIDHLIARLPFNIIGRTFLESGDECRCPDLCAIVEQRICDKLLKCSIAPSYIDSMYHSAARSLKGKQFLWNCLLNKVFSKSLNAFFIAYLSHVAAASQSEFYSKCPAHQKYTFFNIVFLLYTALDMKSPCRAELYDSIHNSGISTHLLTNINKMFFIFS